MISYPVIRAKDGRATGSCFALTRVHQRGILRDDCLCIHHSASVCSTEQIRRQSISVPTALLSPNIGKRSSIFSWLSGEVLTGCHSIGPCTHFPAPLCSVQQRLVSKIISFPVINWQPCPHNVTLARHPSKSFPPSSLFGLPG